MVILDEYIKIIGRHAIEKEIAKQNREIKCREREEKESRRVVDSQIIVDRIPQRSSDKHAKVEFMDS